MKPGNKSSEFWLIVALGAAFLANGTTFINVPWDQMTVLSGLIGIYAGGRSWVKTKAAP